MLIKKVKYSKGVLEITDADDIGNETTIKTNELPHKDLLAAYQATGGAVMEQMGLGNPFGVPVPIDYGYEVDFAAVTIGLAVETSDKPAKLVMPKQSQGTIPPVFDLIRQGCEE